MISFFLPVKILVLFVQYCNNPVFILPVNLYTDILSFLPFNLNIPFLGKSIIFSAYSFISFDRRTSSLSASVMILAAVLTVSPMIVYSRLSSLPIIPQNAYPLFSPTLYIIPDFWHIFLISIINLIILSSISEMDLGAPNTIINLSPELLKSHLSRNPPYLFIDSSIDSMDRL